MNQKKKFRRQSVAKKVPTYKNFKSGLSSERHAEMLVYEAFKSVNNKCFFYYSEGTFYP